MQIHERLYIDGAWVKPATSATLDVVNPYTEEVIARVPEGREADIDRAVAAARVAFDHGPWPRMTASHSSLKTWKWASATSFAASR